MFLKFKAFVILLFVCVHSSTFSQKQFNADTIFAKTRDSITVYTKTGIPVREQDLNVGYIISGKKTEIIDLKNADADLSIKAGRQIFAKVPGVFIYDMDGSGNQINIAARGLDPHRGWEFNIRKDGVITNSDMYGYPASHYNMPMESIERIEIMRGTGSLQYGAQFGGMVNYVSKSIDTSKKYSLESIQTIGSFRHVSSFNSISIHGKKLSMYAYLYFKKRDGFRNVEHTEANAQSVVIKYRPFKKFNLQFEWSRSSYLYRIPGPLNDSVFSVNPTFASRERNYFNPDIHIPSISAIWYIGSQTELRLLSSAVLGKRNSVLFDKPFTIRDTINLSTNAFNLRQVDIDQFNSYTTELKLIHYGQIGRVKAGVTVGIQYMNNFLKRNQLGIGTANSSFDLTLTNPNWGRMVQFKTKNWAFFAESKLNITRKLEVTGGFRVESGTTHLGGYISYYPSNKIPVSIPHHFPIFGFGFQYNLSKYIQVYGGWTQSYRPVIFKDLIPASVYETVNPNIKDVNGYNAELGVRGNWNGLRYDITYYLLKTNRRFGTMSQLDANNQFITYRTNVGDALNKGIELLLQYDFQFTPKAVLSIFTSSAYLNAKYVNGVVKSGNQNTDITNNKIESAPNITTRNGITIKKAKWNLSVLYSYVASTFSDPLNTVVPIPGTGAAGIVPAYALWDAGLTAFLTKSITLKLNGNNLLNKMYFTKRPLFYPGPGVWPSEGRSFTLSVGLKL
ncbi:TonB-dependent receptor family protein [Sediminibacterium sp.]|uniref:TonB-dependent receptor family protein n=1 Tax=Sediminibacterium sp. TaxID=1917865 RepID=UPI003F699AE3